MPSLLPATKPFVTRARSYRRSRRSPGGAMEDCCAICAEPLTHVAYGPCGHRDACVECVARLRFVMEDRRCVICQVPCERVFATRHMGEYTETIGADGFEQLPKRARAKRAIG